MKTLDIQVRLCTPEEFLAEAKRSNVKPWYGVKHLRGFCYPSENLIVVIEKCPGELALVAHEYGHLRGREHTIFPAIMNFSGLFRWFANDLHDLKRLVAPYYARFVAWCEAHAGESIEV